VIKVYARCGNGVDSWEEDFTVRSLAAAEEEVKQCIDAFNVAEKRRYGEGVTPRLFLGMVEKAGPMMHNWEKVNAVCDAWGNVNYRCRQCGLVKLISHQTLCVPADGECYPDRVCRDCNTQFASAENCARHKARGECRPCL